MFPNQSYWLEPLISKNHRTNISFRNSQSRGKTMPPAFNGRKKRKCYRKQLLLQQCTSPLEVICLPQTHLSWHNLQHGSAKVFCGIVSIFSHSLSKYSPFNTMPSCFLIYILVYFISVVSVS